MSLSKTVPLLTFLLRKARSVFLDVIFYIFNFVEQSDSEIRLLLSTCASLYCSHYKEIREDFDEPK